MYIATSNCERILKKFYLMGLTLSFKMNFYPGLYSTYTRAGTNVTGFIPLPVLPIIAYSIGSQSLPDQYFLDPSLKAKL